MAELCLYHNSHSLQCRTPFGAVGYGQNIYLSLLCSQEVDHIYVRLWRQDYGESRSEMRCMAKKGRYYYYTATIEAPIEPTVIWYFFGICQGDRTIYYGNNSENTGGIGKIYDQMPPSYQITVHDPAAKTPRWLKHAIMYQIFVDRFYNGKPDKIPLYKPGAMLHMAWDDPPFYIRDEKTGHIVSYDYYGGNLAGVRNKLSYLNELGVNALYFNPIFEANSNHKYDTADYKNIDPMYGSEEEFALLCRDCQKSNINIVLDGVFSHTGSDSIYFNKKGTYPLPGAYQSASSSYYSWYKFTKHPTDYESWWGIDTLPNVNELDSSYVNYIIEGSDSVVSKWMSYGIRGWRLDVADELPDEFIKLLRRRVKELDQEGVLIGEVWEDASHKISYGKLRTYFGGEELDSVMNYPFREIVLDFMLGRRTAQQVNAALSSLYENYPLEVFYSLMNLVGSHDVPRMITLLGEAPSAHEMTSSQRAEYRLNEKQYNKAVKRLKLVAVWQMTFPGVPTIYYGDEAGIQGYQDPYNRGTYPWGKEDQELLSWYKKLIALRNDNPVLRTGSWVPIFAYGDVYCYLRQICQGEDMFGQPHENSTAIIALNRSVTEEHSITLQTKRWKHHTLYDVLHDKVIPCGDTLKVRLPPLGAAVFLDHPIMAPQDKESGILLPVSCLPSKHGIGDLGEQAYYWIDFLAESKQSYWQILPLNPPGYGESPYQAISAFAGNHMLLSLERLCKAGLLLSEEIAHPPTFPRNEVEYDTVRQWKEPLLYIAFKRFKAGDDYYRFIKKNKGWLPDYALFMALKKYFGGKPWYEWEESIAFRQPGALQRYNKLLREQIEFQQFLQYAWEVQWLVLKEYANRTGIKIIGDLPLFIAHDSSDVWSRSEFFNLNAKGYPAKISGVPPDYFSATGQLWGNPIYNWETMAVDQFSWWCARVSQLVKWVDIIRLDHFRGYQAYWQVDYGAETAEKGEWIDGPGINLFDAVARNVGPVSYIAEDLGIITADVGELRKALQIPGTSVLQFNLREDGWVFPDRNDMVLYTGTHDNDTIVGWFKTLPKQQLQQFRGLANAPDYIISSYFIELLMKSKAQTVIFPLQDLLGLDNQARFNLPGTVGDNWKWRLANRVPRVVAKKLARLVEKYNR